MSNVVTFQKWRKNHTAEEFFLELAQYAALHPDEFNKIMMVTEEQTKLGDEVAVYHFGVATLEGAGLLQSGIYQFLKRNLK